MITNFIVKITWRCNLCCDYCYVTSPSSIHNHEGGIISLSLIRELFTSISDYLSEKRTTIPKLTFYWHGGEPLLAGKDFFRKLVILQKEILPKGIAVSNCIQTNGVLLDDEWADILYENNYAVTFSIDGNKKTHDFHRHYASGKGTYNDVVSGMNKLIKKGYPACTLTVLTPEIVFLRRKVYYSLREIGVEWMDFLVPYNLPGNSIAGKNSMDELADFWIDIFEAWMEEGNPQITIRYLKDIITRLMGGDVQFCLSGELCSSIVTIDKSGEIYVCDDIMHVQHGTHLGNISVDSLVKIEKNNFLTSLTPRINLISKKCRGCKVFETCKSGCPGKRGGIINGKPMQPNIYCGMYKKVILYISERIHKELSPVLKLEA